MFQNSTEPYHFAPDALSPEVPHHSLTHHTTTSRHPRFIYIFIYIHFEKQDFDACLHTCRTSSRSLKGGNQYRSGLRYCFSDEADPSLLNTTTAKSLTTGCVVTLFVVYAAVAL